MALKLSNCNDIEELNFFIEAISLERWTYNDNLKEQMGDDEYNKYIKQTKTFDLNLDFDAYYCDFLHYYQIDLLDSDIDFIRFNWLLDSLFIKEGSAISKRLEYRNYKPSKNDDSEYKKQMSKLKKIYSLNDDNSDNIYNSFRKGDE